MKAKYSSDVDILMVWLSEEPFDYAEEVDGVITHFSAAGKRVLLEIQGAKDFLVRSLTSLVKEEEVKLPFEPGLLQGVSRKLDRQQVRRALESLPPEQKEVILLAFFGDYTHREIAERLTLPLSTVKGRMRLAMQKLRSQLLETGEGGVH